MKKLLLRSALVTLPFIMMFHATQGQTFIEHASLTGVTESSSEWGDYDDDGDLDILITGSTTSKIYRNDDGVFTDIVAGLQGVRFGSASWGDYDNDGDLDILLSGNNYALIYRNDAGLFTDISAGLPGVSYSSAGWGDFDNDGDLDFFLMGSTSSNDRISRIYRNDNGIFNDILAGLTGVNYGKAAWGDFDNDQDLDLVLTGTTITNQRISIIYRNDNGIFNNINSGIYGTTYSSVAWGDYDNDGDLDLLLCGYIYITKLYRNDGGLFNEVIAGLTGVTYGSVSWGDCDNDGDLDIVLTGQSQTGEVTKVFLNNSGTFTDTGSELTGTYRGTCQWGDYDKDGDLDILLTGGGIAKIYRNDSSTANTVPAAPSGLTATAAGNGMVLSWNKATDGQTPQNGLTYNLYIGTVSGAVNKRSPMSVLPGGYRKIAARGDIQTNSWTIKRLPVATYYWSVQTIDHGLAGSSFATQGSFTVPFYSSVAPSSDQVVAVNQSAAVLTVTESSSPTSRQWKYSMVKGGPYSQSISGATGTTCSPVFSSPGTYYIICESIKGGIAYISNEVKLTVSLLNLQTGIILPTVTASCVKWGDYDNDGDLDLFISGFNNPAGPVARIYRNDSGTFTDIDAGIGGVASGSADWGDYDNDGDLDLVVTGNYTSVIYRNTGGVFGIVSAGPSGLAGVSQSAVAWGDYDNDGDLDLILAGYNAAGSSVTKLYRNNNGVFIETSISFSGVNNGYLSWGDYDNDGDQDLLLTGASSGGNISKIYQNTNGLFTDISAGLTGILYNAAGWGDYDNDGDLDLFLAGGNQTLLYNNSNGNFAQVTLPIPGVNYSSSGWGDYDSDGDLDLIITGSGTTGLMSRIYRNDNGIFTEAASGIIAVSYGSAAWGDYDSDGRLDLLLTGTAASGDVSYVYKNTGSSVNNAPSAPAGLTSSVEPNRVVFSWDKSTDSTTPSDGIGYNLYIGTSAGSVDRRSPQASVPGGYRRVVKRGLQGNSWFIEDLPSGTYYWSVQAIDNSFSGSAFAAENSFTVAYSTSISPDEPQTLVINQNGTALTVTETTPADSRQWKYSIVTGGPYNNNISGATGITCTPNFSDWGTYYIVCESVKDSEVYRSNEVMISLPVFTPLVTPEVPGTRNGSVRWGDFDNDSDLDILTCGGQASMLLFNNAGVFTNSGISLPYVSYASAQWGDYDKDGDIDLLTIGSSSRIYRNDGPVTFTNLGTSLPSMSYPSAAWGDYDNDGDLDFILTGNGSAMIYRNDNSSFTGIEAGLTGITMGSVTWGDYDKDGDLDILITGSGSSDLITRIYRNDKGTFTGINTNIPGVYMSSAAWGDYDSDGDLDILISGYSSNGELITRIYRNDNGVYPDIGAGLPGLRYSSVSWHDYDNDGDLDAFISGTTSTTGVYLSEVYRNDNGTFVSINANLTGVTNGSNSWGDYDNDGDLDLMLSGQSSSSGVITTIYRNNITTPNTLPSVPANLQSAISSNKVDLTWSKSTDSKTPQNGISYNLYIGTAPGLIDKKSPQADLSTGYRKIPLKEGQNNGWYVRNLSAGTYYWSVQAVDNTFAGSAFAPEASFTLPFSSSVSPSAEQILNLSQNGTLLTVTESSVPSSRQWKYSTVSGGPYSQVIAGATDPTYTPNFSSFGTYYVVCESVYNLIAYVSNEVKISIPVFTYQSKGLTGAYVGSAEWGDYDNDGDPDIVITSTDDGSVIYRNDAGAFTDINAGLPFDAYSTARWADYDNDGDLDLFWAGYASQGAESMIYRNDAGVFSDIKAGLPGIQQGSAAWGDYDNDGDLDILFSGSNLTRLFRNDDGSFSDTEVILPGLMDCSVAWADFDKDGDLDILITGAAGTSAVAEIYRNDNGDFVDIDAGLTAVSMSSVDWGDFDNDGDPDILLSGKSSVEAITIIYRNSNGVFTDINAGLQGVYYSSVKWGDYDNDGDLDVFLTGESGFGEITRVYRNDGGVFVDLKDGLEGLQQGSIALGDYDKDGDLDILVTGIGSSGTMSLIYKNNSPVANVIPAIPSNLISITEANSVTLSWNKSTDTTTPQNGLTYNVYLGSSPGGIDIITPQSAIPGGYRRVVRAERNTSLFKIRNLPAGDYFWSVQAIDNSFAGSAFASEAGFSISYSNSVSPSANQSLGINETGAVLTVNESAPADSRQWKYSTTRGGPYDHVISGATAATYTPVFQLWGSYYIVCESVKGGVGYISNEVFISLPVFLEQTGIALIGLRMGAARWGDYDSDGDLDILVIGGNNEVNASKIYRNDNGIFTDINAPLTGVYQATGSWGDYDADGDLDLFIAGYISSGNYSAKIYRNDSGTFADIAAGLAGVNLASGTWTDYDNDGDLDLLLSGMSTITTVYIITLYRNDNGLFNPVSVNLPGVYGGSIASGDYDNDGDQDIAVSGRLINSTIITRVYRNDNGSYTDINAGLQGVYTGSVLWGDYDNDGDLDLFVTGVIDLSSGKVSLIYNNNNGIFTDINAGLPELSGSTGTWGDFDNDGDPDLLISGLSSDGYVTKVFRNETGVFTDIKANIAGAYLSSTAWGDYNNDGNLDILIMGYNQSEHFTKIYKNTGTTANIVPSAPSNLVVTAVTLSEVRLTWNKATDTETPQNTLTYNLRIGNSPGSGNKVGPMASLTSGYRRIPARGNAEFKNTGYNIKNLSPGTYYWSVQAIDQAYAGGAWAPESSFTLLAAPVATAATNVLQPSFTANWNASALATGYKIDVSTNSAFSSFLTDFNDKDVGNTLNASVTGLDANTTYYYRVRAYQTGGTSLIYSNTITVTTPVEVPVPTATSAASITQTGFSANWTTVASAVSYSLDVATDNAFTTFITGYNNKNVGSVITSNVTGLTANTTYYYRVRANGAVGTSVSSNTITVSTLPDPPAAPASIAAESISSSGFILKWRTSPAATTYYLDISTESDFASFITGYNDLNNGSDTSKTVTGLSPVTTYYFRARAANTGGTSSSSATGNATTLPEIPAAPVSSAAASIGQVVFTANWSASTGASGYRLDVSADVSFTTFVSGYDNLDVGNVTNYDVSGLTAKTNYYYRVRAYNVSGTSGNSSSITLTTLPNPPAAPSGLSGSSCNNLVTLTWTANTETDFQKYIVYGGTTANPATRIDSTLSISTVTKTISGLTSGQTYYFRITAVISPGVASQYSTSVSVLVKKGVVPKIKSKFTGAVLVCYNPGDSIATWQWYRGAAAISGATKQYYITGGTKDSFSVLTTDKNGCQNSSSIINLTGTKSVSVYPNPAGDNFTLKFSSEYLGRTMISLINASGVKVLEWQTDKPDEELECIVPVSKLPDGLYTVEIVIEGEIVEYSRVMVIN